MIKNFSSPKIKMWLEPIVFPGSLAVLKSCGEAALNFLGKNAFGLIQKYYTIIKLDFFKTALFCVGVSLQFGLNSFYQKLLILANAFAPRQRRGCTSSKIFFSFKIKKSGARKKNVKKNFAFAVLL